MEVYQDDTEEFEVVEGTCGETGHVIYVVYILLETHEILREGGVSCDYDIEAG